MINFKPYSKIILGLVIVIIFGLGIGGGYLFFKQQGLSSLFKKDIYLEFTSEAYDVIKQNYWEKITDEQLTELFKLATEKVSESPQVLDTQDSKGVQEMMLRAIKDLDKDKKKEFVTNVVNIVLVNLKPFGRSQLYTMQQETQLRETVSNIDKGVDLYESLGVDKTASQEQIAQVYEEKKAELLPQKDTSPEAAQELAMAERAFAALSQEQARQTYDQTGAKPTILAQAPNPDIAYIRLTKLSPQSFEEFQTTANNIDKTQNPTALILDLRGNIGGSIDLLQYFLGPFIGQNQLAYEFFHQEEYQPFKTQVGWLASLVRYKKVVVLIDGQTQSSAEVMAAVLKKYNVGILVGVPTKGWGTVENTFPLKQTLDSSEKYSILLVHSLTLRDDNQPIEGKGVDPVININDQNWQQQLLGYFNYQALVDAVEKALRN